MNAVPETNADQAGTVSEQCESLSHQAGRVYGGAAKEAASNRYEQREALQLKLNVFAEILRSRPDLSVEDAAAAAQAAYTKLA